MWKVTYFDHELTQQEKRDWYRANDPMINDRYTDDALDIWIEEMEEVKNYYAA